MVLFFGDEAIYLVRTPFRRRDLHQTVIDQPFGTGWSYADPEGLATTEEVVAQVGDFVAACTPGLMWSVLFFK